MKRDVRTELNEMWTALRNIAEGKPASIKKYIRHVGWVWQEAAPPARERYPEYFYGSRTSPLGLTPAGAWDGSTFKVTDKKKQQSCEIGPDKPIVRVDDHGVHIEARQGTPVHLDCWVNDTTKMGDCLIMGSPWAQSHIMQMDELQAELRLLKQKHCDHTELIVTEVSEESVPGMVIRHEQGRCKACGLTRRMSEWGRPCDHHWIVTMERPVEILSCYKCGKKKP
jgi:hypothetical protein